jgi:hypothetical protein
MKIHGNPSKCMEIHANPGNAIHHSYQHYSNRPYTYNGSSKGFRATMHVHANAWESMQLHGNPCESMENHGNPWNPMEIHATPINCMERDAIP